jgi:hypothetical protein
MKNENKSYPLKSSKGKKNEIKMDSEIQVTNLIQHVSREVLI